MPNAFVTGACVFPQNAGKNPTGPVGALAYWAADAIKNKYLKTPGPLVRARALPQTIFTGRSGEPLRPEVTLPPWEYPI